jgi:lipopolysaccharide/colanic/teichoic acid biosynthesis glycosyltransferase
VSRVIARPVRRPTIVPAGQGAAKRTLDIVIASTAIIILAPLIALLALLVRLTSPGPAFFRQERLGLRQRPFTLLKLRSMYADNDDRIHREFVTSLLSGDDTAAPEGDGIYKIQKDPRITAIGAWLRKTSLDELPQLFNVLGGSMSLVGPRPVLAWEADMFCEADRKRFDVKPGITGLWQVSGRNNLSFREALELDIEYVRRGGLTLDLLILVRTLPSMFLYKARLFSRT